MYASNSTLFSCPLVLPFAIPTALVTEENDVAAHVDPNRLLPFANSLWTLRRSEIVDVIPDG